MDLSGSNLHSAVSSGGLKRTGEYETQASARELSRSPSSSRAKSWLKWSVFVVAASTVLSIGLVFFNLYLALGISTLVVIGGILGKLIYDRLVELRQADAEMAKAEEKIAGKLPSAGKLPENSADSHMTGDAEPLTLKSHRKGKGAMLSDVPGFAKSRWSLQSLPEISAELPFESTDQQAYFFSYYQFFNQTQKCDSFPGKENSFSGVAHRTFMRLPVREAEYLELCTLSRVVRDLRKSMLPGGADCQGWTNSAECFLRAGIFHRVIGAKYQFLPRCLKDFSGNKQELLGNGGIDLEEQAAYSPRGSGVVAGWGEELELETSDNGSLFVRNLISYANYSHFLIALQSCKLQDDRYLVHMEMRYAKKREGHYANLVRLPSTGRYVIIDKNKVFPVLDQNSRITAVALDFFDSANAGVISLLAISKLSNTDYAEQLQVADSLLINALRLTGYKEPSDLRSHCLSVAAALKEKEG